MSNKDNYQFQHKIFKRMKVNWIAYEAMSIEET